MVSLWTSRPTKSVLLDSPMADLHARLCLRARAALASMRLIRVERRRSASPRGSHTVYADPVNGMIFRATQKVSSKLRIACTAIVDSHPSMVEWYCNLITVRRRQFFLFTHASSL